ncbi:MAG: 8-amino-7-oxononanoate synthase [Phycisphaerae bacterium]|nr:8-amino-7-oxononanoate synthase [Gemmatimonadaceae bacterium]
MTNQTASTSSNMDATLDAELLALQQAGLKRGLRAVMLRRSGTVQIDSERVADFASNDYLGLAADPRVARAATAVLQAEGTGAGAARLISGHHPIHDALESELAAFKHSARALLFPAGYMANVGTIPALAGEGDVIYSDAHNHASIVDGCRLSHATKRIFPHGDIDALRTLLEADRGTFRRSLIVVEGVFSMDGDTFPLDQLVPLARMYNAWTYVDDAHGAGVLGLTGRGTAEHFGVSGEIDVTVGTLGKSFGTMGAYVAGSRSLIDLLISTARAFIFTTGTPPALAAATLESLHIARAEPWRREAVRERATQLRDRLRAGGRASAGMPDGHIIPIAIGDPMLTMAIVHDMRKRGFLVGGVRPPTVPAGTSRLRISVSAMHPPELVDTFAASLLEAMRGIVP